ncbi:response regulator [Desulfovibrio sp. JC022]|uniref:response regulator n=1 Tax=Desulfovibrio sp. JC022 TaxID=2593642 RepID=UPI0013D61284|nr:response regulator [Desulfovibrio sp. JC022]
MLVAAGSKIKAFLVKRELRFARLAASVAGVDGVAFYITDEHGVLTFVGDGCRDLERKFPTLLAHLYSEKVLENIFNEISTSDGIYRFDKVLTSAEGKQSRFSYTLQYVDENEGKAGGLAGTVRDISGREELRSDLDRERRYLETVMNDADETMFIHDLDGNFLKVNNKFSDFAGVAPELCVGTSIYNYLAPQIADKFLQRLKDISAGGNELSMQIPALNSRGEKLQLDVRHVLCRNGEGDPEAIVGYARKIAGPVEKVCLAKGEGDTALMRSLCHEMRTPLAGIIGSLHVLDSMDLAPDAKEYVRKCVISAERFKDVVNISLNDLAGNFDPQEMESLDPAACLEKNVGLFLPAAAIQNRTISLSLDSGIPEAIICKRKVLSQALFCLINSGLEVFPDSDINVGLKLSSITASYSTISFYVAGSGSMAESGKIYSDCLKQNVELIDGELFFNTESPAELGFSLKIPAGKKKALQAPDSVQALRIILAEDDISSQVFMRKKLENWGHLVRTASTGVEVLNYMDTEEFDLVLMDLQMPEMNGFAAISAIRQGSSPMRNLPIIVMSAYGRESDFEKMSELGVDDYIAKPVSTENLAKAFERLSALGKL